MLSDGHWYYYKADGTLAKDENVRIDHSNDWINYAWYSFDKDGCLRQDEVFQDPQDSTQWRYAFPSGALATTQWVRLQDDGTLYELGDASSYGWYYFSTTNAYTRPGAMLRGQHMMIDGAFYAFDENGKMYTNTWLTVENMARPSGGAVLGTGEDAPYWGDKDYMTYYGGNGQRPVNMTLPIGEQLGRELWYTFNQDGQVTQVTAGSGTNNAGNDSGFAAIGESVINESEVTHSISERVPVKRVQSVTATPAEGGTEISYTPGDTLNLTFIVEVYNDNTTTSNINHNSYLFWVEAYGVDSPARLTAQQLQVKSEGKALWSPQPRLRIRPRACKKRRSPCT